MLTKYNQLKSCIFPRSEWKTLENRSPAVNEIEKRIAQIA